MKNLTGNNRDGLKNWFSEHDEPGYQACQVLKWVHQRPCHGVGQNNQTAMG